VAKPFSIQSPEDIAMEYGGNKQKIAQAMQLGVVDPTAGVLAGMFIDRMRSAQMQEQAPQATVAQQVMGGAPATPPPPPSGGLGATPQAAPPMAPPQMGTPPEAAMVPPQGEMMTPPQEKAPMGMAEGGIVGIDIPDTMFDESSNGGFDDAYAGGGLVAFAGGSPGRRMTDEEYLNYIIKRESGGRDYDKKGRPLTSKRGAKYAMQVRDDTARSPGYGVAPAKADTPEEYNRVGREYALALRKLYGDEGGAAAYNMGPGAYEAYKAGKRSMPKETQNYIAGLGAGLGGGLGSAPRMAALSDAEVPDILALAARNRQALSDNMSPETKRRQELIAEIEAGLAPEAQKKLSDQSKWEALAQFGFNLAGKKSPNFLQGIGEAAVETLPALAKARSEQKAASRADRQALATLEKMSNEEKQQMEQLALELAKAQAGLLSDERKMDLQLAIAQMDDNTRKALGYMSTYADIWKSSFGERQATRRAGMAADAKAASNGPAPGIPSPTTANELDFSQLGD